MATLARRAGSYAKPGRRRGSWLPWASWQTGAGQIAQGLAAIEEAIEQSDASESAGRWQSCCESKPSSSCRRTRRIPRSLDWARRQRASWGLRAATGVARLWHEQGRTPDARGLLVPVYERFTEGFDTADLREAKTLIGDLG